MFLQKRRAEQEAYRKFQENWQREQREQAKRKFEEQQRLNAAATGEGSLSLEDCFSFFVSFFVSRFSTGMPWQTASMRIMTIISHQNTCRSIGTVSKVSSRVGSKQFAPGQYTFMLVRKGSATKVTHAVADQRPV
jgi:hypothetical protein